MRFYSPEIVIIDRKLLFFGCSKIFENEQTTKNKSFKGEKIFLILSRIHDFKSAKNL